MLCYHLTADNIQYFIQTIFNVHQQNNLVKEDKVLPLSNICSDQQINFSMGMGRCAGSITPP